MARGSKDLTIALKVQADLEQAQSELAALDAELDEVAGAAGGAAGRLNEASRSADGTGAAAKEAASKIRTQAIIMRKAGITAGQYQQAMRQLPMQMTDIVTSIASGMPVWMVAIQQGGQLRDSFGGVGATFRAVLSTLNPMTLAVVAMAASVGAVVAAAVKGQAETSAFARAIITTGNVAGTTTGHLHDMAETIAEATDATQGMAARLSAYAVSQGLVGDTLRQAVTAATAWEQATDEAGESVVDTFASLAKTPVAALAKLNESEHFLTLSIFEQIRALHEQGDAQAAAELATQTYGDTLQDRAEKIEDSLGYLEAAWKTVGDAASSAWDFMLDIGRPESLEAQLAAVRDQLRLIDGKDGWDAQRRDLEAQRAELDALIADRARKSDEEDEAQRTQDAAIAAVRDLERIQERTATAAERQAEALAEVDRLYSAIAKAEPDSPLLADRARTRAAVDASITTEAERAEEERRRKAERDAERAAEAARQQDRNRKRYVAGLERQAATLGKTAAEARRYEIAENDLTGALKARAEAAAQAIAAGEAKQQADADAAQLTRLRAQLLTAQGRTAEAASLQLESRYGDLIDRLTARGDSAGLALIDRLINVKRAEANLTAVEARIRRLRNAQSREESRIEAQREAGVIGETEARRRLLDLHEETREKIEALLPTMQNLAAVTGDADAIERVKDLEAWLTRVKETANHVVQTLKSGFTDGLAEALEGLATRTHDLQEAARSFLTSIAQGLARLAAQDIARLATDTLSSLVNSGTDTATETTAATTAAGIMTAGIASGGTTAATTMGGAITAAGNVAAQAMAAAVTASSTGASTTTTALGALANAAGVTAAGGGHVTGPGTATSDSIPARLSDNEFVTRAAVVTQPGALAFLHDFNRRGMVALSDMAARVRHATGGLAGVPAPLAPAPILGGRGLAEPAKAIGANLTNTLHLNLIDDPARIASALTGPAGVKALTVTLSRNPAKFRQILGLG